MYRAFGTGLIRVHNTLPVSIRYPLRLVRLAVEIHHYGVAQGLDFARLRVTQQLFHLEAGVAHFKNATLANNRVVKLHRLTEVQVNVDKDIFEGQPVNFGLKDMLEVAASTHVEVVALRPVVDMVVRVEVAHADLYRTRVHRLFISSQNAEWAAT